MGFIIVGGREGEGDLEGMEGMEGMEGWFRV